MRSSEAAFYSRIPFSLLTAAADWLNESHPEKKKPGISPKPSLQDTLNDNPFWVAVEIEAWTRVLFGENVRVRKRKNWVL